MTVFRKLKKCFLSRPPCFFLFAGAALSLLLPSLPPTVLPTHSVGASGSRSAASLLFVYWRLLVVLVPPRCAAASCCPRAHSPPPFAVPLPLVTPLPCVMPLLFGWLLHSPEPQPLPLVAPPPGALASAIHQASTFRRAPLVRLVVALPSASSPISLQLHLVPWPLPLVAPVIVTAFGVVCRHSRHRLHPVQRLLPQGGSGAFPNISVSIVVAARGLLCSCRRCGHPHVHPSPAWSFPRRCPCRARPLPGRGPEEGASPSR